MSSSIICLSMSTLTFQTYLFDTRKGQPICPPIRTFIMSLKHAYQLFKSSQWKWKTIQTNPTKWSHVPDTVKISCKLSLFVEHVVFFIAISMCDKSRLPRRGLLAEVLTQQYNHMSNHDTFMTTDLINLLTIHVTISSPVLIWYAFTRSFSTPCMSHAPVSVSWPLSKGADLFTHWKDPLVLSRTSEDKFNMSKLEILSWVLYSVL